jgi:signal transduction histidine kinase
MTAFHRALLGLAGVGLVTGLLQAPLLATSDVAEPRGLWVALMLVIGYGFLGVGIYAWWRRPDNRVGSLMVATAFAWFVFTLSETDVSSLFTVGATFGNVFAVAALHLALAYPSGRLGPRADRIVVFAGYVVASVVLVPATLFFDPAAVGCGECPANAFLVHSDPGLAEELFRAASVIGIVYLTIALSRIVLRWLRASRPQRRELAGVLGASAALLTLLGTTLLLDLLGAGDETTDAIFYSTLVPFGLVPWIFLAGLARARILAGGKVGDLVARLSEAPGPGALRDALADTLADPSLELAYWIPQSERYVDFEGRRVELPPPGGARAVTGVEHEGRRVAAIVHDTTLLQNPNLVRAAGSAAALALENERLEAELRAKVEELRSSRERLIEAGMAERRSLERNLHDGAQQRLVSLALSMRMARGRIHEDPDSAEALLDKAGRELELALRELRELARGIHPAVLSERGLPAALGTLAHRAPLEVEVAAPEERLPAPVELAAYYVVSEALTNVVKYADATRAAIEVSRDNGRVTVEVSDDGVGGADPARGSGLRGLADRVGALDGRLEVDSERGGGTTVRARIPCG